MNRQPTHRRLRQAGFYYAEALVSTVIVGVCLAPAVSALHSALQAPALEISIAESRLSLQKKLEHVLAQPYTNLDNAALAAGSPATPSSYSESAVLVYLARYDGDNADGDNDPYTGTDPGLLWVRVQTAGGTQSLAALATP